MMPVRKMLVGVAGVFICWGVLSVRSRGLFWFVMGDGEGGGCGESSRVLAVVAGYVSSICVLSESVLGADLADFCPSFLKVFVGAAASVSFSLTAFCVSSYAFRVFSSVMFVL